MGKNSVTTEALEYIQQLVGGNSNAISKLQAVVPGLFSTSGSAQRGKTDRRFLGAELVDGTLIVQTIGRDQARNWRIVKVEGSYKAIPA